MPRKDLLIEEAARYIARSQRHNLPEAFDADAGFGKPTRSMPGGIPRKGRKYTSDELKLMGSSEDHAMDHVMHYREKPPSDIDDTLRKSKKHGERYRKQFGPA